jgi:hypothetical protein
MIKHDLMLLHKSERLSPSSPADAATSQYGYGTSLAVEGATIPFMMSKFRVAPANMVKLIRLELNVRFAPRAAALRALRLLPSLL